MINRRNFLTRSIAFGAAVAVPRYFGFAESLINPAGETVITILHTNDTHSQIDPLPANDRNAGKGGVASGNIGEAFAQRTQHAPDRRR
jgi:5'-nucleotidase